MPLSCKRFSRTLPLSCLNESKLCFVLCSQKLYQDVQHQFAKADWWLPDWSGRTVCPCWTWLFPLSSTFSPRLKNVVTPQLSAWLCTRQSPNVWLYIQPRGLFITKFHETSAKTYFYHMLHLQLQATQLWLCLFSVLSSTSCVCQISNQMR